jgi:hypothetical protein
VIRQVWIRLALRNDSLKIVFACQTEQTLAISVDVIAIEQPFALPRNHRMQAKFAVGQWQIPKVFAVAEPALLLLIVRFPVLIPENIECVEQRFGASEKEVSELRFAVSVETYDLAIEDAAATFQVANQPFAQFREALECVSVPRNEPHAVFVGMKQCPEAVPLDLEEPVGMAKRSRFATERDSLEMRDGYWNQYIEFRLQPYNPVRASKPPASGRRSGGNGLNQSAFARQSVTRWGWR